MSTPSMAETDSAQDTGQSSTIVESPCFHKFLAGLVVLSIGIPMAAIHCLSWEFDYKDLMLYYGAIPFAGIPIYGIYRYISNVKNELLNRLICMDDKLSRIDARTSDIAKDVENIGLKVEEIETSINCLHTKASRITSILERMDEAINKISDIVEKIRGKLRQVFSFVWSLFWQSWLLIALVVIVIILVVVAIAILV